MNGWTSERKARQAALIHSWKPWQQSTGPRTAEGKARSSMNGWTGGHWWMLRELSRQANAEIRAARRLMDMMIPN